MVRDTRGGCDAAGRLCAWGTPNRGAAGAWRASAVKSSGAQG